MIGICYETIRNVSGLGYNLYIYLLTTSLVRYPYHLRSEIVHLRVILLRGR